MNTPNEMYKYVVESMKHGKWVPVCHTDFEDTDTFVLVANAEEYRYRILLDGVDITERYKKIDF
jgi:hypothetical protein